MSRVDRVLDVRQGELCWVAGTVYMDMPLKPNILEDISQDVCRQRGSLTRAQADEIAMDFGASTKDKIRVTERPGSDYA